MFQLDDGAGPARPVDDARMAAMIAGALGAVGFPAAVASAAKAAPAASSSGGAGAAAAGAAKGVAVTKLGLLAGGAVAIAFGSWVALRAPAEPRPAPPVARVAVAPVVAPPAVVEPPAPTVTEPPVEISAPVVPAPAAVEEPAPAPRPPPHPPAGKPRGHAHAPRPTPAAGVAVQEDLLASANAARAAHRWRQADALYTRVVSGGATELAVQAALVASASLHLEHLGDPAGVVRRFRAALAAGPRDALAEDARWGLAEATRATGDPDAEAAALEDFLAHHAGSPRAARARARRGELKAAP